MMRLFDTHTHFDEPVFDVLRAKLAQDAYEHGVSALMLVGYVSEHFSRLFAVQAQLTNESLSSVKKISNTHVALGLHPAYVNRHEWADLEQLEQALVQHDCVAIGEIGLDTYLDELKTPQALAKQQQLFVSQLDLAVRHQLPVLLHIRKAHAEVLQIIKRHAYDAHTLGGIAHSFSGGEQEAIAFVRAGFKLGVTGQICQPNAKKLRRAIKGVVDRYGIECLVIETDCPDMTPITASRSALDELQPTLNALPVNVPANLPLVLQGLSELLDIPIAPLADTLWRNSHAALRLPYKVAC